MPHQIEPYSPHPYNMPGKIVKYHVQIELHTPEETPHQSPDEWAWELCEVIEEQFVCSAQVFVLEDVDGNLYSVLPSFSDHRSPMFVKKESYP